MPIPHVHHRYDQVAVSFDRLAVNFMPFNTHCVKAVSEHASGDTAYSVVQTVSILGILFSRRGSDFWLRLATAFRPWSGSANLIQPVYGLAASVAKARLSLNNKLTTRSVADIFCRYGHVGRDSERDDQSASSGLVDEPSLV